MAGIYLYEVVVKVKSPEGCRPRNMTYKCCAIEEESNLQMESMDAASNLALSALKKCSQTLIFLHPLK